MWPVNYIEHFFTFSEKNTIVKYAACFVRCKLLFFFQPMMNVKTRDAAVGPDCYYNVKMAKKSCVLTNIADGYRTEELYCV